MGKKAVVIILAGIILIIAIILLATRPKPVVFSEDPKDWIETEGNSRIIDISEATNLNGFFDDSGLQLRYPGLVTALAIEGAYKGQLFQRDFVDEQGKVRMRINNEMNPNDGIIEGFILEKKEGDKLFAYLFVDEDWKKSLPQTIIYWGQSFISNQQFNFLPVSEGIYLNIIEDDLSRFSDDFKTHMGGIIVGDVTKENFATGTYIKII